MRAAGPIVANVIQPLCPESLFLFGCSFGVLALKTQLAQLSELHPLAGDSIDDHFSFQSELKCPWDQSL